MIRAEAGGLAAQLLDLGIRLRDFREGVPHRARCPKCDGGREHEDSLTVTIDPDGRGAVWNCHRGTCGWTDNIGGSEVKPFYGTGGKRAVKPEPLAAGTVQRNANLYRWFEKRGISEPTVNAFQCCLTTHYFHAKGEHPAGDYPAIVFPYFYHGDEVNRKYRSPNKQLAQEKDPLPTLFNIDAVVDDDHAVWVEGETDCMAVYEAGWHQAISLKDGAPPPLAPGKAPDQSSRRFAALNTHAGRLEKIQKFYLAGDTDEPGKALMEELARRLGRHRCWLVTWPEGRKDAGEVLQNDGPDVLNGCIANARPYPIEDVQEVSGRAIVDYLSRPSPPLMTTGLKALDKILRLPGEGRLIVVTGMPNAGKSPFLINLMTHLMMREDRRFLVFSPEMQPWEEFCAMCAQVMVGKPARKPRGWKDSTGVMTVAEQQAAGDWLNDRLRFLASDAEDKAPTLEWILDRGTESAVRLGITDLVIDPWNEVEHQRGGATETDYTGRALQKAKAFSYRHGCNVWIVVHPTKMRPPKPGEPIPPPGPYDINGSSNFANKADLGLTIHRPEDVTQVHIWKSRFFRWGSRTAMAELHYDTATGRYSSPPEITDDQGPDSWDIPI